MISAVGAAGPVLLLIRNINTHVTGVHMKVYFGNYWTKEPYERAGKPIPLNRTVSWYGSEWRFPALYLFPRGIIIDAARKIPSGRFGEFYEKWQAKLEGEAAELSQQEQARAEAESPFTHVSFHAETAQSELISKGYSSVIWQPACTQNNDPESVMLMEEYGCDRTFAWQFYRICLEWKNRKAGRKKPVTLHLKLCADEVQRDTGTSFTTGAQDKGREIVFTNPVTGMPHSLKITEVLKEKMDQALLINKEYEYPQYYQVLRYKIEPPMENGMTVRVSDSRKGENPRRKANAGKKTMASSIGVLYSDPRDDGCLTQASGMYFEEPESILWSIAGSFVPEEPVEIRALAVLE